MVTIAQVALPGPHRPRALVTHRAIRNILCNLVIASPRKVAPLVLDKLDPEGDGQVWWACVLPAPLLFQ